MTEVCPSNYKQPLEVKNTTNVLQLKKSASFIARTALLAAQQLSGHDLNESLKPWNQYVDTRSVDEIISSRVLSKDLDSEDAFYVADLGEITRQHATFKQLLPRIEPFYAVKCNPDPMILKTLVALGTGFDCASKAEIQMVLDQGVKPSSIIYANPCKQASHIRFANTQGVQMMTFDNLDELLKIKNYLPQAQLVLRILTDDSKSLCKLGTKFGASQAAVPALLQAAKNLELNIIGVSFHVGSGCFDAQAFGDAVTLARKTFDLAESFGFHLTLLDVGGGFPGRNSDGVQFTDIARILRSSLDLHFPPNQGIRIIAEPGRYYASSAYTLVVNIVARRRVPLDGQDKFMYYINDGMYGSFNCITFDHATVHARPLVIQDQYYFNQTVDGPAYECSIWGPTCDSIDCIGKECLLPIMNVGDYMYFENMGAYTMCAASQFNGFKKSSILYTNTEVKGNELSLMDVLE